MICVVVSFAKAGSRGIGAQGIEAVIAVAPPGKVPIDMEEAVAVTVENNYIGVLLISRIIDHRTVFDELVIYQFVPLGRRIEASLGNVNIIGIAEILVQTQCRSSRSCLTNQSVL